MVKAIVYRSEAGHTKKYSHILDDDRKNNAQLFQDAFYDHAQEKKQEAMNLPEGLTQETLARMLENPEIMALLGALSKKL